MDNKTLQALIKIVSEAIIDRQDDLSYAKYRLSLRYPYEDLKELKNRVSSTRKRLAKVVELQKKLKNEVAYNVELRAALKEV